MPGATVDRAQVVADGGGSELAQVAMSRAWDTSHASVLVPPVPHTGREWGTASERPLSAR